MELTPPFALVENAWNLKKLMHENQLIMVYSDPITQHTYQYLMKLAEEKLDHYNTELKNKKKILHILVEALQNISKHGQKDEKNSVASLFVIGTDEEKKFFVISGNTISSANEPALRETINRLNALNPDEIREHYKHSIQNNTFTEKGGAGLGFIDIIRKSNSKIHFHFASIDPAHSFFTFKVNILPRQPNV